MLPVVLVKALTSANASCICTTQTHSSSGVLVINGAATAGGVATLDTQRRILVTSASNDSTVLFTLVGTREGGIAISDQFIGGNATAVQSNLDFLTVTSVTNSSSLANTVTVGTNAVGSTPWKMPNYNITPFQLTIGCATSGSSTSYSAEYTYDDYVKVLVNTVPTAAPVVFTMLSLNAVTVTKDSSFNGTPIRGWRLTVNSGLGTTTATGIQAGIRN